MKPLRTLLAVAAVLALATALNPSAERHRQSVREAVADRSPLAGVLGVGRLTAFAATYHPLVIASYTTVDDRVLSIGAFGLVHVRVP